MDMVCEKVAESTHDFEKDPIRMLIDGDTLRADGTTLGGDDGLAVAYAQALLEDEKLVHPALEVLITTNEETGMDGAMAIHAAIKNGEKPLSGKLLLNIDNEDEGVFLVGCAGGANFQVALAAKREKTAKQPGLTLKVHGLKGGHSGQKIIEGRGNAIKLLARLLNKARCASSWTPPAPSTNCVWAALRAAPNTMPSLCSPSAALASKTSPEPKKRWKAKSRPSSVSMQSSTLTSASNSANVRSKKATIPKSRPDSSTIFSARPMASSP